MSRKKNKAAVTSELIADFRQAMVDGNLGEESEYVPTYSTGIDILDYRNGRYESGDDEPVIGLDGGRIVTIVGNSGTGKTTLAIQIAGHIVEPYEHSQVIHYDFERATKKSRIEVLNGWSREYRRKKYIHLTKNISTEKVFQGIKAIEKLKMANYDSLKIDSGKVDPDTGEPIYVLPPTVVIVDSLAVMMPSEFEEADEMKGGMSATQIAKVNTQLVKRVMGPMENANIILIFINHINKKVETDMFSKTKADIPFLKQDETLPGGRAPAYLANVLIKLEAAKKLTPEKDFKIRGLQITGELIKSRSNATGVKFDMIFDLQRGFRNVLTNYLVLADAKVITGTARKSLPGFDKTFYMSEVEDLYENNEDFRKAFDKAVREQLQKYIPTPLEDEELEWDEELGLYRDRAGGYWEEDEETGELVPVEIEEEEE